MNLYRFLLHISFIPALFAMVLGLEQTASADADIISTQEIKNEFRVRLNASPVVYRTVVYRNLPALAEVTTFAELPGAAQPGNTANQGNDGAKALRQHVIEAYPEYDFVGTFPSPVSLDVQSTNGDAVVTGEAPSSCAFGYSGLGPYPYSIPRVGIPLGKSRGAIVDISPWFSNLKAGRYVVTMRLYGHSAKYWTSNPITVDLVDTGDVPRQLKPADIYRKLSRILPVNTLKPWMIHCDVEQIALIRKRMSPAAFSTVAVHLFLSAAINEKVNYPSLLPILDAVPENLRSLRDVLQLEVLAEQGKQEAAEKLANELMQRYPEFSWRIDLARAGKGLIAQTRTDARSFQYIRPPVKPKS
jgi:hypothetical protein